MNLNENKESWWRSEERAKRQNYNYWPDGVTHVAAMLHATHRGAAVCLRIFKIFKMKMKNFREYLLDGIERRIWKSHIDKSGVSWDDDANRNATR